MQSEKGSSYIYYTQISVYRIFAPQNRDTNGLLPYKFVWEEVSPILYGADTLLYDPLALCDCVIVWGKKGTFVYTLRSLISNSLFLSRKVPYNLYVMLFTESWHDADLPGGGVTFDIIRLRVLWGGSKVAEKRKMKKKEKKERKKKFDYLLKLCM